MSDPTVIINGVAYRSALPTEGVYPGDICVWVRRNLDLEEKP